MAYGDSATESLAAVRAAIADCLTSQAYGIAGRSQRKADLKALRDLERELIDEANSIGYMASVGQIDPAI